MKAISLWQPWASAVVLGFKRNETRGWATRYRGPLAIHAAKRWEKDQLRFTEQLLERGVRFPAGRMPLGQVLGVAWLVDCQPTGSMPTISARERELGNYGPGRFAWLLEDAQPLTAPLPFVGRQGFFDVPVELLNPLVGDWFAKVPARA